jgi:transcriptional regulator with XRE-family HTH domain
LHFLRRVFRDQHRELIREIGKGLTFGRWIEAARNRARLLRDDIALAIGKEVSFVESLEKGAILPWALRPDEAAMIIDLFGIQIDDFSRLISVSLGVNKARDQIQQDQAGDIAARAQGGRPSEESSEDIESAVDMALAHVVGPAELNEAIKEWLSKVSTELRRIQMTEILP